MGRISHPSYGPGRRIAGRAQRHRPAIRPGAHGDRKYPSLCHVTPRALKQEELPGIVAQYAAGARRAETAGFDGVEINNANGCLLDQFLRDGTNHRTDDYGGFVRNRARLTLEVTVAVTKVWGADRVGIRFSPGGVFNDMHDSDPLATFSHVLHELNRFQPRLRALDRVHGRRLAARRGARCRWSALRQEFHGPLIVANGFTRATATQVLAEDLADAVAFGRLFIANPDLARAFPVERAAEPAGRIAFLWRS